MMFRIICLAIAVTTFTGAAHAQFATPLQGSADASTKNSLTEPVVPRENPVVTPIDAIALRKSESWQFGWVSADYSLSGISRSILPALVTSSPSGVAQADAGVLGRNSTNLLLGQGSMGSPISNGMRLTTGVSPMEGLTFEVSGFFILNGPATFDAGSNGLNGSAIARPFFEPITGQEAAQLVAFPNRFAGSIDVSLRTNVWGIDGAVFEKYDLGIPIVCGVGFRYVHLGDDLGMVQNTTALNAPALTFNGNAIPLSDSVRITDSFRTQNDFIGPQLCLRSQYAFGRFIFGVDAKIALGSTGQTVVIAGRSDHLANGAVVETANGGFLASPTNIGTYSSSAFSVIPEVNLKLGYNATPNLNVFVGYDFMAWTNVVRAGEQIDRTVNLTQIPTAAIFNPTFGGPASPAFQVRNADLFVHSLRVGLEWKY